MIKSGFILISDISGYTQFLTESELMHANEIITALFETQKKTIQYPFHISSYRGDAIQMYCPDEEIVRPQMLFEMVEHIYVDFQNHLRQAAYNTTCPCAACSNMSLLDLKFFVHHGEFLLQHIDGRDELQGRDVIVAHRLMKNNVKAQYGIEGYALFTDAAFNAVGIPEMRENTQPYQQEYEHLGLVEGVVHDLEAVWKQAQESNRITMEKEDAWAYGSFTIDLPKTVVWDYLVDPETKKIYAELSDAFADNLSNGRIMEGTRYHCVHKLGDIRYEIVDWQPFEYFTARERAFGISYTKMFRLTAHGDNRTTLEALFGRPDTVETDQPLEELEMAYQQVVDSMIKILTQHLEAQIAAGKINVATAAVS